MACAGFEGVYRGVRDAGIEFGERASTCMVLYLMCDDAPARRAELLGAGLDAGDLHQEEYGSQEFALRDPDGYVIRFSSPGG